MRFAPLNSGLMLTSMLGFLLTSFYVWPASKSFGLAFGIVFVGMFIASIVSMTYGPSEVELKMDRKK
jgi:phosphate/sulfate permease